MAVVCLVRHGQASFGADDYDVLSDLGHQQARVVGAELARRALRAPLLLCGSLVRQRDTAAGIIEVTGWGPVESDPRWDEYDHIGMLRNASAGAPPTDNRSVQELLDTALVSWIADPDGGWPAFVAAGATALRDLAQRLGSGRDAVVVTSGGVIAAISATLLGAGAGSVVALNRVAVNTAITTLLLGRGGVSLSSYNDHAHALGDNRALLTYR